MRAPRDLAIMVTCFNLSLIWIKKSASEYICIISTLKRIFGRQIQVFHKLADTADEFTQLFSFYLFLHICICMYIFIYIYIVVYMCISCVKITFLQQCTCLQVTWTLLFLISSNQKKKTIGKLIFQKFYLSCQCSCITSF